MTTENPRHIAFKNSQVPGAAFDLIRLEDLNRRVDMDHSPFQLHLVEFYLLILIEPGEGYHTVDFNTYWYQPGSVITIRKNQIHQFHRNEEVRTGFPLRCAPENPALRAPTCWLA